MKKVTIATRGSQLALWQAEHIKSRLMAQYEGLEVELLILKTKGDIILDVPLAKVGGKGLFVKEIEEAEKDSMRSFEVDDFFAHALDRSYGRKNKDDK